MVSSIVLHAGTYAFEPPQGIAAAFVPAESASKIAEHYTSGSSGRGSPSVASAGQVRALDAMLHRRVGEDPGRGQESQSVFISS